MRTVESHIAALIEELKVADRQALLAYVGGAGRLPEGVPNSVARARSNEATHTFLFTDVVGSSRLWQSEPARASEQLQADMAVIAGVVGAHNGRVFSHRGRNLQCLCFRSAGPVGGRRRPAGFEPSGPDGRPYG